MSSKQQRQKAKILELLERTPIIEIACKKVGIARSTYYRWVNEDDGYREQADTAILQGRDCISDVAESKLIARIQEGDMRAIAYWLESNNKRYYKPRRPIVHNHFAEGGPPTAQVQFIDTAGNPHETFEDFQKAQEMISPKGATIVFTKHPPPED